MYRRIAVGLLLLALGAIGSWVGSGIFVDAAPADFLGIWVNTDTDTGGMTRLIVSAAGAAYTVEGFGRCHPTDCEWGSTSFQLLGYSVTDMNPLWGFATWDFGFTDTYIVVHREGDLLVVESYDIFKDNSGRSNYRSLYLMRRE